eukprot:m.83741 g.83741  ORF g.83741 m.83741 type:complete len:463 (-) comp14661_c0_seq1:122-1510(-)
MSQLLEAMLIGSQLLPLLQPDTAYLTIPLLAIGCIQTKFTRLCLVSLLPNAILTTIQGTPSLTCTMVTAIVGLALWHWVPLPTLPKPTGPLQDFAAKRFCVPGRCAGLVVYPCTTSTTTLPYTPTTALPRAFLDFGAPAVVKKYFWFVLDHWICMDSQLHSSISSQLLSAAEAKSVSTFVGDDGMPVVIFSHGNGANGTLYSAMLLELASHGFVCITLDHNDGSSCLAQSHSSKEPLPFDRDYSEATNPGDAYVWGRRYQCSTRIEEVKAACQYVQTSLSEDIGAQSGQVDKSSVVLAGHSFGGGTMYATTLGVDVPQTIKASVVYDPAMDWSPPETRALLTSNMGLSFTQDCPPGHAYHHPAVVKANLSAVQSIPLLVLYSSEWDGSWRSMTKCLAQPHVCSQSQAKKISGSTHVSLSDTCHLLPAAMTVPLGLLDSSKSATAVTDEQRALTMAFLAKVWQ